MREERAPLRLKKPGRYWPVDSPVCPCGAAAGPNFTYGLCDKHAQETPAFVMFLIGGLMGEIISLRRRLDGIEK